MIEDIMYFAGGTLASGGMGLIYPPAGLITFGVFLMISAFVHAKKADK